MDEEDYKENRWSRWAKRAVPMIDHFEGTKLTVRQAGKRLFTPMLIVMIAIGSTDLLFALDSIPAIYGLTSEPYLVFTANVFALMGLRQLYFLLGGLLQRLIYLTYGLSFILAFIGVKLVLEALHLNELGFINGGEHVSRYPVVLAQRPCQLAVPDVDGHHLPGARPQQHVGEAAGRGPGVETPATVDTPGRRGRPAPRPACARRGTRSRVARRRHRRGPPGRPRSRPPWRACGPQPADGDPSRATRSPRARGSGPAPGGPARHRGAADGSCGVGRFPVAVGTGIGAGSGSVSARAGSATVGLSASGSSRGSAIASRRSRCTAS